MEADFRFELQYQDAVTLSQSLLSSLLKPDTSQTKRWYHPPPPILHPHTLTPGLFHALLLSSLLPSLPPSLLFSLFFSLIWSRVPFPLNAVEDTKWKAFALLWSLVGRPLQTQFGGLASQQRRKHRPRAVIGCRDGCRLAAASQGLRAKLSNRKPCCRASTPEPGRASSLCCSLSSK